MYSARIEQLYRYLLREPCSWLFYYYFQPARFQREIEPRAIRKRVVPMLRLSVPILSTVFLVSVLLRKEFCSSLPALYTSCAPNQVDQTTLHFLMYTLRGCLEGLFAGVLSGICVDLAFGISMGLAVGLVGG